MFLVVLMLMTLQAARAVEDWTAQRLGVPFGGQHTGVAVFDLNGDGSLDILFAAGRHRTDQSYALVNLGYFGNGTFRFSDPIPIGDPGGYYQVDATSLSSLSRGHTAVLLAGGSGSAGVQPAVVLNVSVTGCSVNEPKVPCESSVSVIWKDENPQGDRNGAFAPTLGDGTDSAIILAGNGCVTVFEPVNGTFSNPPSFVLLPDDKVPDDNDNIKRAAGLAVGMIGNLPGFVAGVRTSEAPSPLGKYRVGMERRAWNRLVRFCLVVCLNPSLSFSCCISNKNRRVRMV